MMLPREDALAKLVMDLREMHGMTVCGEAWQELELDSEQMAAEIERYVESQLAAEQERFAEADERRNANEVYLATKLDSAEAKLHLAQLEIDARKQECQTVTRKRDAAEEHRESSVRAYNKVCNQLAAEKRRHREHHDDYTRLVHSIAPIQKARIVAEAEVRALREALEIDYQAMKYPPGVTANFHIIEAIVNNRTASRKASLHTMQDKALG